MKFNDSVIMTIPGIGYINGGMILGEIGDIHRFSNPNKLLAFAGLDPSVYQSGNFQAKTTRMSKRGSRVLRYALVNAAGTLSETTQPFWRLIMMPRGLALVSLQCTWALFRQTCQSHLEDAHRQCRI